MNSKNPLVRQRWQLLKAAITNKSKGNDRLASRRQQRFGLVQCDPVEDEQIATDKTLHYNRWSVGADCAVILRQRPPGAVSIQDFKAFRDSGVDNTGNVCLWPSEEILAYLIYKNRATWFKPGDSVCELGGGVSLAGFTAAVCCPLSRVLLTDGNAEVVSNISANLDLNRGRFPPNILAESALLLWDAEADLTLWEEQFDHIFAADCLFFKDFHDGLIHVLCRLLRPNGTIWLLAPPRGNSLEIFLGKVRASFSVDMVERYDEDVWKAYQSSVKKEEDVEDFSPESNPNLNYPFLIKLHRL